MGVKNIFYLVMAVLLLTQCEPDEPSRNAVVHVKVSTDKAAYNLGEVVKFTLDKSPGSSFIVRYKHLGETIKEERITETSWTWNPPIADFKGYMVELLLPSQANEEVIAAIGVDVSSRWTKFPRYGFLSKFPQLSDQEISMVMDKLNRYHINGIQFYDWHYKHHKPLAGTPASPDAVYKDIINRDIYKATIDKYITSAHNLGMSAMFYNLAYGALKDASSDGVLEEWYVYTDNVHSVKDKHDLPEPPFVSDIFLTDPSHVAWQDYLADRNDEVYSVFDFDGFHIDQLGDRGLKYAYDGTAFSLNSTFDSFIGSIKSRAPGKYMAFNAVNQYGQEAIASSPVDFLYTEVWSPNEAYADLATIIKSNNTLGNNTKNSVLAAYVNYDLATSPGFFNTPSVLMANAVIFAFGGSHIELGEHMLGREYFPNDNLKMRSDLQDQLTIYYDFLTAYENILRDGGTFNGPVVAAGDVKINLNFWPPQTNQVSYLGKLVGNKQVVHLINFSDAATLQWRDNQGVQKDPGSTENFILNIESTSLVKKIWFASPDLDYGASRQLPFTQSGNQVSFVVPFLKYWDMIVIEW